MAPCSKKNYPYIHLMPISKKNLLRNPNDMAYKTINSKFKKNKKISHHSKKGYMYVRSKHFSKKLTNAFSKKALWQTVCIYWAAKNIYITHL
jgi:DNA polymerase III psi subunit